MEQKFSTRLTLFGVTVDVQIDLSSGKITLMHDGSASELPVAQAALEQLNEYISQRIDFYLGPHSSGAGRLARVNPTSPADGDLRSTPSGTQVWAGGSWRHLYGSRFNSAGSMSGIPELPPIESNPEQWDTPGTYQYQLPFGATGFEYTIVGGGGRGGYGKGGNWLYRGYSLATQDIGWCGGAGGGGGGSGGRADGTVATGPQLLTVVVGAQEQGSSITGVGVNVAVTGGGRGGDARFGPTEDLVVLREPEVNNEDDFWGLRYGNIDADGDDVQDGLLYYRNVPDQFGEGWSREIYGPNLSDVPNLDLTGLETVLRLPRPIPGEGGAAGLPGGSTGEAGRENPGTKFYEYYTGHSGNGADGPMGNAGGQGVPLSGPGPGPSSGGNGGGRGAGGGGGGADEGDADGSPGQGSSGYVKIKPLF